MVKTAVTSLSVVASEEGRGDNFALLLPKVGTKPPDSQLFDPLKFLSDLLTVTPFSSKKEQAFFPA